MTYLSDTEMEFLMSSLKRYSELLQFTAKSTKIEDYKKTLEQEVNGLKHIISKLDLKK